MTFFAVNFLRSIFQNFLLLVSGTKNRFNDSGKWESGELGGKVFGWVGLLWQNLKLASCNPYCRFVTCMFFLGNKVQVLNEEILGT